MSDTNASTTEEKEFQYKFELIKKALVTEKHKNTNLEIEVKSLKRSLNELENELNSKDKKLVELTIEKNNLISQIDFHRHSKIVTGESVPIILNESYNFQNESTEQLQVENKETNNFTKSFSALINMFKDETNPNISTRKSSESHQQGNFDQVHLTNKIICFEIMVKELQKKNEDLIELNQENNNSLNLIKIDFQNIILSQSNKIKTLENDLAQVKEEYDRYLQNVSSIIKQNKSNEILLLTKDNEISKLNKDVSNLKETLNKFQMVINEQENYIKTMKSENLSLKSRYSELKKAITEENLYALV